MKENIAKPVAAVETTRTPRVRVVATGGGGGFVWKVRKLFSLPVLAFCPSSWRQTDRPARDR